MQTEEITPKWFDRKRDRNKCKAICQKSKTNNNTSTQFLMVSKINIQKHKGRPFSTNIIYHKHAFD